MLQTATTGMLVQKLCKGFESKRKQGKAVLHSSGYGGSGFRFDHHEDDVHLAIKMRHAVDLKNPAEDGDDAAGDAARAALNSLRERTEAHGDGEAARIAAKYCVTAEQPPECVNVSDVRPPLAHFPLPRPGLWHIVQTQSFKYFQRLVCSFAM